MEGVIQITMLILVAAIMAQSQPGVVAQPYGNTPSSASDDRVIKRQDERGTVVSGRGRVGERVDSRVNSRINTRIER